MLQKETDGTSKSLPTTIPIGTNKSESGAIKNEGRETESETKDQNSEKGSVEIKDEDIDKVCILISRIFKISFFNFNFDFMIFLFWLNRVKELEKTTKKKVSGKGNGKIMIKTHQGIIILDPETYFRYFK